MKKKITMIAFGLLSLSLGAQIPNYVPTNGLQGWWPFSGNANDYSSNANNGTVNGASLTSDRFNNIGMAYSFDGVNDNITLNNSNSISGANRFSFSCWIYFNGINNPWPNHQVIFLNSESNSSLSAGFILRILSNDTLQFEVGDGIISPTAKIRYPASSFHNSWKHIVCTYDSTAMKLYIDGVKIASNNISINLKNTATDYSIGNYATFPNLPQWYKGKIDDIGYWNRALDSCEVKDLYFASLGNCCNISVTTQPINQSVNISNNAQFTTSSSDSLANYQWQSDNGFGFQNISNAGQYSGTTNDTLTVSNVTMTNNNQLFRCIVSSGSCTDTSAVAVLTVVNNTGINEVSLSNLFSVYPNPAKSQINVKADAKLLGSVYSIYDNTGKLVLSGKINSENTVIDLGNLSGGIYLFSVGENLKQTFKVIKE